MKKQSRLTPEQQLDEIQERASSLRAELAASNAARRIIIEKQIHAAWLALETKPQIWTKGEAQTRVLHAMRAAGYNLDGILIDIADDGIDLCRISDEGMTADAATDLAVQISFVTGHPCAYEKSRGKTVDPKALRRCVEQWRPSLDPARGPPTRDQQSGGRLSCTREVLAALELMDPRNSQAAVARAIDRAFPQRHRPSNEKRRQAELEADLVVALGERLKAEKANPRKSNKRR